MRVDLVDLSLFRHVVEAGSITRGAERANLALAAASTRIRTLERDLGTALLLRGRTGIVPTPAGRALLSHARTMLAQAERLRADLGAFAGGSGGEVRLLSNTNAILEFLPDALGSFLAAHPRISVDLEERLSDEIVGMVAEGIGAIGIVAATVETGGLETFPFRQDRFVVIAPVGDPVAAAGEVDFASVLDRDVVGLDRQSALQRFLSARAARLGRTIRLRVQLRSFDGICRLVEAGVGIGIVPETTARRLGAVTRIAIVRLSDPWAARDLTLCVRGTDELTPASRLLFDHLRRGGPELTGP